MTTLVAITNGSRTIIGSDSSITNGRDRCYMTHSKFAIYNGWAIGVAGPLFASNVVNRHYKDIIGNNNCIDDISDALVDTLIANNAFVDDEDDDKSQFNPVFLVANKNGIWLIDSDKSTIQGHVNKLVAEGSGANYAIGAGHAMITHGVKDHMKIIERALDASSTYDVSTSAPYWIDILK